MLEARRPFVRGNPEALCLQAGDERACRSKSPVRDSEHVDPRRPDIVDHRRRTGRPVAQLEQPIECRSGRSVEWLKLAGLCASSIGGTRPVTVRQLVSANFTTPLHSDRSAPLP
jgi:hypothetical protein